MTKASLPKAAKVTLGGASRALPPVTIGALERIQEALDAPGGAHVRRIANVVNAALGEEWVTADSRATFAELKEAFAAVMAHAGLRETPGQASPGQASPGEAQPAATPA